MSNPVIVFVNPMAIECQPAQFPIGFPGTPGLMDAPTRKATYTVVLLDDSIQKIDSNHTNRDPDQTLFIVAHGSSKFHRSPAPPNGWGKAFKCEDFSHVPKNQIFEEIKDLIFGNMDPIVFAKKRTDKSHFMWLDQLASTFQLERITPGVGGDFDSIRKDLLEKLGVNLANEIEDLKDPGDDEECEAPKGSVSEQIINRLREEAARVAS
jgi:hypothetical protein